MTRRIRSEYWGHLTPFLPSQSAMRMAIVSATSFLGSIAESGVLVIVALTADSLVRGSQTIAPAGIRVTLTQGVALAFLLVLARVLLTLAGSFVAARLIGLVMGNAQHQIVDAYLRSSHSARSSRTLGDLSAVVVNHGRMTGDLANAFTTLATALCSFIAFGGTSLVVNPIATIGISIVGFAVIGLIRPLRRRNKVASKANAQVARDIGTQMTQLELLHREIEVFRVGGRVLDDADRQFSIGARRLERLRFLSTSIPQIFQAALLGAAVLSLLVIVNVVSEGANVAAIGAVVLLLIRSMSSTQQVVTATQSIVERGAYVKGVTHLIAVLRADERMFGDKRPGSLAPVVLDDVSFTYDGDSHALKGMSTKFMAGELVGIVGPSGAGKSTLVELLLRLRQPTFGTITVGSVPIDNVAPENFGSRVAFVPQKPVLITGTVAENIDFFRDLPEEQILQALRGAHLEDEINALPDGIHTKLGPDDRSLSGGQQQRLTIARALAGDPEILVLDEPTSALDSVSEEAIRRTLDELPTGRVVIIVAHRYSTLASCSRILVIEHGELKADASPEEVARKSDFFKAMVGDGIGNATGAGAEPAVSAS